MAKKPVTRTAKAGAVDKATKPVRLDLTLEDHERLERLAKRHGLSKTSYVRLALFGRMEQDETKGVTAR